MLNHSVSRYCENDTPGKLFGVEIEAEGPGLRDVESRGFRLENDGSLGDGGVEFVQRVPATASATDSVIRKLVKNIRDSGAQPRLNPRSGVHIHINMQDYSVLQAFTFLTAYYVLEDALVALCHPGREGNFFCLRLTDSSEPVDRLVHCVARNRFQEISTHGAMRYSAMNLDPLLTYGSVEFRALHSPEDFREISPWVSMFDELRENSIKTFRNPQEVIDGLSAMGRANFVRVLVPSFFDQIVGMADYEDKLQQGCWNIQRFAFSSNW